MSVRKVLLVLFVFVAMLVGVEAQAKKTVRYGKSTFTVYEPVAGLAPIPLCGFTPPKPGYTLKSRNYGPGTYYSHAPGKVSKTAYSCILTEIRDWVYYSPEQVMEMAALKGLVLIDEKPMLKMFKNSRLPQGGLLYQLDENSWIHFTINTLQNSGPVPWGGTAQIVQGVSLIERVVQDPEVVLDRLFRFWNDGVQFADYAGITQSNFNTQPTAPTDQNPNNFAIGDVLNPQKGFYRLSFAGGAGPSYVWYSYSEVLASNLKKSDFDATGEIGFNDILSAFTYSLDALKVGKDLYFSYSVREQLCHDLQPGRSWKTEIAERKSMFVQGQAAIKQVQKANEAAMEKLYQEIFRTIE